MDLLKEALLKSKQLCAAKLTHIPFGTGLLQADTCSQGHAMEVFSRAPQQDGILPCPRLPPGLCLLGPCSLVEAPSLILYPSPPSALPWGPFWCWVQEGSREALTYLSFHNWDSLRFSSSVSGEKEQGWTPGLGLPGRSKARNRAVSVLL